MLCLARWMLNCYCLERGLSEEPDMAHVCRLLHRAVLSTAAAPGQLHCINTPLRTGLSYTSPGLLKQQKKALFICCIIVYNRVTSFSDSKESLRAEWGSNIKHSLGSSWHLFSKSKEIKYTCNSWKLRVGMPYLLTLSMSAQQSLLSCPPLHPEINLLSAGSPLSVLGEAQRHPTL